MEVAIKDTEIIASKREAWGKMGVAIYNKELDFSARSQQIINSLKSPETFEEIKECEALLKQAKSDTNLLSASRIELTGRLMDVSKRLMVPENNAAVKCKEIENTIVVKKREYEAAEKLKRDKEDATKRLKEVVANYITQKDFEYKSAINNQCAKALEWALNNDVTPETLNDYLTKVDKKLGAADFQTETPMYLAGSSFTLYLSKEEIETIVKESFITNPHAYASMYQEALKLKFSDFNVAFNNKQSALALSLKQQAEETLKLEEEKKNKEMAAKLDTAAAPLLFSNNNVKAEVKELKKFYVVDMPDTLESSIAIWHAFIANMQLCLPKLKITKWLSATPQQLATALAKCKNDDDKFQPTGIIFKESDKL